MSQHFFETTFQSVPIVVQMGYDRPLSAFYMVVHLKDELVCHPVADDEGIIYSNLYEMTPFALSLEYFRGVLSEKGIAVPDSMFTETEIDSICNTGNRQVMHFEGLPCTEITNH